MSGVLGKAVIAAFVAIAAVVILFFPMEEAPSPSHAPSPPVCHTIPLRSLPVTSPSTPSQSLSPGDPRALHDDLAWMEAREAEQLPAVHSLHTFAHSPELQSWSPAALCGRTEVFFKALRQNASCAPQPAHTFFYYDGSKPIVKASEMRSGKEWRGTYTRVHVPGAEFLAWEREGDGVSSGGVGSGTSEQRAYYEYWSGSVEMLEEARSEEYDYVGTTAHVRRLLDARRTIRGEMHEEGEEEAMLDEMNIWMGSDGVTSRLHFDASNNFYTQLFGRKRFILGPPAHHSAVYMHSFLHPSSRQSLLPFERWVSEGPDGAVELTLCDEDLRQYPLAKSLLDEAGQWSVATLTPGDTLYIPAFWFHHVTAVHHSVSLSFYQPSEEKIAARFVLDRASEIAMVLQELNHVSIAAKVRSIGVLLATVFRDMSEQRSDAERTDAMRRIIMGRFGNLKHDPVVENSFDISAPSISPLHLQHCSTQLDDELESLVKLWAPSISKRLRPFSQGVKEIVWADFGELLFSLTVGLVSCSSSWLACVELQVPAL